MPVIEKTWFTHCWANRVFQFILSISEVNTYKAFIYFVWQDSNFMTLHEFRRKLANALIHNEYLHTEDSNTPPMKRGRSQRLVKHEDAHILLSVPVHARIFLDGKWKLTSKSPYQQFTCKMPHCSKQTHFYCKCTPVWVNGCVGSAIHLTSQRN